MSTFNLTDRLSISLRPYASPGAAHTALLNWHKVTMSEKMEREKDCRLCKALWARGAWGGQGQQGARRRRTKHVGKTIRFSSVSGRVKARKRSHQTLRDQ